MAKLLFLGSGSAFTVGTDNFQSNLLLINNNGEKLLIDCGADIRFSLNAVGLSYRDINNIYISHLHSDHIGGLEYIGFNHKFNSQSTKPSLYLHQTLAAQLWQNSLSGGMRYITGEIADLNTFFNLCIIDDENNFLWSGIKFKLIKVIHVDAGSAIMPSYGLFFTVNNCKILITTDTQFRPNLFSDYYQEADLIFHDCEISPYPTPVHPNYQDLITLPSIIKQKMWLYGYQPLTLPDAKKDGFRGFVKRGDIFNFP